MINDILRRTTNTQAAVFTEKYDQANGTTSRKKKNPGSPLSSAETSSHLLMTMLMSAISKNQHGFELLSTLCSAGLHGAYAARL